MNPETTGEPDDIVEARARAGRAVRRLGHALIGRHAPAAALHRVAHVLEEAAAALEPGEVRSRRRTSWGYDDMPEVAPGTAMLSYPDRPFSGVASPLAVDIEVVRTADGVAATVVLGPAHEGAPERSHGGVVAAVFDDLTGFVLPLTRTTAYTGELTIRYEAGIPIGEPILFRAWPAGQQGRKLYIDADAHVGDRRVATAKSLYITVARPDPT